MFSGRRPVKFRSDAGPAQAGHQGNRSLRIREIRVFIQPRAGCVDDMPPTARAIPRKTLHTSRCPAPVAANVTRVSQPRISIPVTSIRRRSRSPPRISIVPAPWKAASRRDRRASPCRTASTPVTVRMMASGGDVAGADDQVHHRSLPNSEHALWRDPASGTLACSFSCNRPSWGPVGQTFGRIRDKLAPFGRNFRRSDTQLHPLVAPQVLHFMQVPLRTSV